MKITFRKVSDKEFDSLAERFPLWDNTLCPTCKGKEYYLFEGKKKSCNCDFQISLARHYLLANIGITYHSLGFEDLFDSKSDLKDFILAFLDEWPYSKQYGKGVVFNGPLGTGKTLAQILILKELIKKGEKCWFLSFLPSVTDYVDNKEELKKNIRSAQCLSVDEVVVGKTDRQRELYEEVLEYIVRYRVENSLSTLMGTNLTQAAFNKAYPRVASLLELNTCYYELDGEDTRKSSSKEEISKLIKNREVRPVR